MRIGCAAVPSGSAASDITPHTKTEYRDAISTYLRKQPHLQSTGRPYREVRRLASEIQCLAPLPVEDSRRAARPRNRDARRTHAPLCSVETYTAVALAVNVLAPFAATRFRRPVVGTAQRRPV